MWTAQCISLLRRSDHRQSVLHQFDVIGLPIHFVDAVDGRSPTVLSSLPPTASVSPSEFGCGLSHRKCWQLLVDSGDPHMLVMEDDVRIDEGFMEAVQEGLTRTDEWDVLHVGYNCHNNTQPIHTASSVSFHCFLSSQPLPLSCVAEMSGFIIDRVVDSAVSVGRATATHAYLITSAAAAACLQDYDPSAEAVDMFFFHHPTLRRLLLTPSVAYQADGTDSDIAWDRRTTLENALGEDWARCAHSRGVSRSSFLQDKEKARAEHRQRNFYGSKEEI